MDPAAVYLWIKAVHVASIMAFVAGVVAQGIYLAAARSDAAKELAQLFHRAARGITTPALLIALTSGVALAEFGRWLPAPWLVIKLILVTALLAIHGIQSGQLRRLAVGRTPEFLYLRFVVLAVIAAIALLAVRKPSLP